MRGKRRIRLSTGKVDYDIFLERKITVLKGNSSTGKTSFVNTISLWLARGRASGIKVYSDAKLVILLNTNWKEVLVKNKDCIIIADEGLYCLSTVEFAEAVAGSDNYFLFVSRSGRLKNFQYSVIGFRSDRVGVKTVTKSYVVQEKVGFSYVRFC